MIHSSTHVVVELNLVRGGRRAESLEVLQEKKGETAKGESSAVSRFIRGYKQIAKEETLTEQVKVSARLSSGAPFDKRKREEKAVKKIA